MTRNKRFTLKEFPILDDMASIDVICDKGIVLPNSTACDLLNDLSEEYEQLKIRGMWKDEKIKQLTEENLILRGPQHHRRFEKHTIDNWESNIIDNFTGEKYGQNIDKLLLLLNTLTDKCMNYKLKDTEKIMKRYYLNYNSVDPTFGELIRLISKDLGVSI